MVISQSRLAVLLLLTQAACSSSASSPIPPSGQTNGSASHDDAGNVAPSNEGDSGEVSGPDANPPACANGACASDAQTPSDDAGSPVNPHADAGFDASEAVDAGIASGEDASTDPVDAAIPEDASALDATIQGGGEDASTQPDACASGHCGAPDAASPIDAAPDGSAAPFSIASLTANQSGRTGSDLLLTVQASGGAHNPSFGLDIQLLDASGKPVVAFANWSGVAAESERIVLFDNVPPASPSHFIRTVNLRGIMQAFPAIHSVSCALAFPGGETSTSTATVALQPVRTLHQSCDSNIVLNRCSTNLACIAGTCSAATPPSLAQFSYLSTPYGGRMLLAGTDAVDDLNSIHFEFLGKSGQPIAVDINGGGDLQTSFDQPVTNASKLGQFFFSNQSSPSFDAVVVELAATPSGLTSGTGNRVVATLQTPPVAANGSACDARGFIGCVSGDVCVNSACVPLATAQTNASQAAPVLNPSASFPLATGYAQGDNLWGDPPTGCAPAGVRGFPQGIVLLHLDSDVPSLTITTNNQETTGGAALFVLSGTGNAVSGPALGCNSGLPATLNLTNVFAGDYTIVVNSTTATGAAFGVSISE